MFYILRQLSNNSYSIVDTDDNSIEEHTVSEINDYINCGLKIKGVENNIIYPYSTKTVSRYAGYTLDIEHPDICVAGRSVLRGKVLNRYLTGYAVSTTGTLVSKSCNSFRKTQKGLVTTLCNSENVYRGTTGKTVFIGTAIVDTSREYLAQWGFLVQDEIQKRSDKIDDKIKSDSINCVYNSEFNVYRPKNSHIYSIDLSYYENMYSGYICTDTSYIDRLISVTNAHGTVSLESSLRVPLLRICQKDGIYYKVIIQDSGTGQFNVLKVTLESIIADYTSYTNVNVTGDSIQISSLDATVIYDINTIYTLYNKMSSSVSIKATAKLKVLGANGNVEVFENGDLNELRSSLEKITIPNGVKTIKNSSLKICSSNSLLVVCDSVTKCELGAFDKEYFDRFNRLTIEFRTSNYTVIKQFLSALRKVRRISNSMQTDIHFTITQENFIPLYSALFMQKFVTFNKAGYFEDMNMHMEYFSSENVINIIKIFRLELGNLEFLNEEALVSNLSKLPFNLYSVTLKDHSTYAKYHEKFFRYFELVTILNCYLEDTKKYSMINSLKYSRSEFDMREKEFISMVGSMYYKNGFLNGGTQ